MKQRADVWLTARGLAESREKAQALIMAGQVYAGEKKVLKASEQIAEDAPLQVRGEQNAFASRGGHKLEKAITAFGADVAGAVAVDIGAATGKIRRIEMKETSITVRVGCRSNCSRVRLRALVRSITVTRSSFLSFQSNCP